MPRKTTTASRIVDLLETFKVDPREIVDQLIVEVAHRRTSVPRKVRVQTVTASSSPAAKDT